MRGRSRNREIPPHPGHLVRTGTLFLSRLPVVGPKAAPAGNLACECVMRVPANPFDCAFHSVWWLRLVNVEPLYRLEVSP